MMKTKKGYSMIVLVIAITVILLLVSSAVSVLQQSREKTAITNFIFDLTTVEEEVQDFYTSTGTLPVKSYTKIDMNDLNETTCEGILSQLYLYDNENYYEVDLSQLGTISMRDSEREYIVNEGSLRVYVKNGVEYSNFGDVDTKIKYYTLTPSLVNGLEDYIQQDEEILVTGNPLVWAEIANLRVILPRQSLEATGTESWEDWTFKWDFGPKTEAELAAISESDTVRNFEYGDILEVKSNGIYSIYVKDPEDKVTVLNINVSKIDDIAPSYKLLNVNGKMQIQAIDNETGIKNIKYKTIRVFNDNVIDSQNNPAADLKGRTAVDYYLMDGQGKDLIYDLAAEIDLYKTTRQTIQSAIDEEQANYLRWKSDSDMDLLTDEEINKANLDHDNYIADLNNQMTALNEEYPYLYDIKGTTNDSRLILYVEDNAGNATVIGEKGLYSDNDKTGNSVYYLSTEILANSYNISLEGL